MEDDEVVVAAAYFILQNKKRKKREWMRPYLSKRDTIIPVNREMELDNYLFKNFTRISKADFETLICMIGPKIVKKNTVMRKAIPVATRLAITLRFLATGDSYKSLMYLFRVSDSSISHIVPEVCTALIEGLREYIKVPTSEQDWKKIAEEFNDLWNFPHCLGAMDGKHIAIICPPNSGSKYFNYKGFFSIVLFAVVNAHYQFLYVHIGCQGRISDGGVFRNTAFGKALLDSSLKLPQPEPLPGREMHTPYVFLADDAFPLTENICKPYSTDLNIGSPKRVCNYRISRGRRIVENVFGLLASVFRVLHTTMDIDLKHVKCVVMTCCYLHNFMRRNTKSRNHYSPFGSFDLEDVSTGTVVSGSWRREEMQLTGLQNKGRNSSTRAKEVRDEFTAYFMSDIGAVPWQDFYLN